MAQARVYFADMRASAKENLFHKLVRLADEAGIREIVSPRNLVALKLHFGEEGNSAFIRPVFVRRIVEQVRALGAMPFLTDTNTLYAGTRGDSVSHLRTAMENGFAYSVVNAPLIIADGIRGASFVRVEVGGDLVKTAYLGKEIVEADALISLAHFKGHELAGFAGTLKNLGMGCASRKGKLDQHSEFAPKVKRKKCEGCGNCIRHCAQKAIALAEGKAAVDPSRCVGCGECILICPNGAIGIRWSKDIPTFLKKMVEYASAVLVKKGERSLFINFLTDISPACDCYGYCDAPIVRDIGIVASRDPVAADQASVDLVNRERALDGSCLGEIKGHSEDKFRALYPKVDWAVQLEYAQRVGLGTRDYRLIRV